MKYAPTIKLVLFLGTAYYLFPSFGNGIGNFILGFIYYLLLLFISHAVINDGINYIAKNWGKMYLRWIDEREHIKGNTLANLTRLDFVGMIFRTIHYARFNKKRFMQEVWYNFRENMSIYLTFILFFFVVIGFIVYGVFFL